MEAPTGGNSGAKLSSRLLNPENTVLLVVDIQEKFLSVLPEPQTLLERVGVLVETCRQLGIPIVVTEQYPKGLGHTASALAERLPDTAVTLEKAAFGCGRDPEIFNHLAGLKRSQVLVCGIETHICVNQTVHQLLESGYQVHLVQDAVSSRHYRDHETALAKMQQSGAIPACVEMALFELLGTSRHPLFKQLQALVK